MILMIPANPSASYLDGGVVITSILSIVDAGILYNTAFKLFSGCGWFAVNEHLEAGIAFH